MDNITQKPHVVILASPGMGHLIPVLELSKRLVAFQTVKVTLFTIPTDSSAAQSQLLQSSQLPHDLEIVKLPPVNNPNFVPTSVESRIFMLISESLPSLRAQVISMATKPSAFIVDIFGHMAFDIANQLKIPKYVLVTSTAWYLALTMYLPILDQKIEGEYVDMKEPIPIPGCKSIRPEDVVEPMLNRRGGTYALYLNIAHGFREANGLLLNTWEDLEPMSLQAMREDIILQQIVTPRIYTIGPLFQCAKQQQKTGASNCLDWLQLQPEASVLYVSFGSGGTMSQEQVTELAWGLELSKQRFIWVVRAPAKEGASGAFFSAGSGRDDPSEYLPEDFLSRIEGVGMVVPDWAPQINILSHPSTGGFISHCGWNSTLESIINGVPMIAWPLYAEQRMNAAMLAEDLGVAIRSEVLPTKGVVKREEIEMMVRLVMDGEQGKVMRARMKEVQSGALKAIEKDGSSYKSVCQLIHEWEVISHA